ncbi:exodeoxyribonuclease V subunit gamma [Dickeya fangzhongdai]|uniref:exodeoxyribonuclease V subunit gamma n=1 Tax=Dickeya fangzhongdai TaxID=1778540 RepID=UPI00057438BD|nr:exodeoxyribonuclease V subunit gamma [Dickeya fangzhongdai]KHN52051.1 exodeoxyribonuclease V subunit gamma [Dickeya fangzhongdai]
MSKNRLQPGLMAIHSNHPEALRDVLVSWMAANPLAGLENELILVQSNGIGQWLKLALARDARDGGCGVAAALDVQLPSRFFWQVYRAVLGQEQVPETSPFDKSLLVWRLLRLLPDLLAQPEFAALARFLQQDADLRKRYQLAERLADLFDQYQVYRADWLAAWAAGQDVLATSRRGVEPLPDDQRWQPLLWRALLQDTGEALSGTSRAALHRRFLDEVQLRGDADRPAGLPSRVMVFGISSLPQQALELLAAIGRWTQIFMCVHNPCEHYWGNIIADKDLLRAERARQQRKPGMPEVIALEELHQHAHPLLAAWGKQGRDYIGLLDEYDQREQYEPLLQPLISRIDLFDSNGEGCLLNQLQEDIRDLRPLAESRARWPAIDPHQDSSIRFHVAHSAQREVEVLHDQLLAAFAADPTLRPRDVIVMVPDINGYAPHIQAVFGLIDRQKDPRYIPFSVADRGPRQNNLLLAALERLLNLPQSRVAVSDVLDLLEVPAVRQRFAITEEQLPLLQRWIRAANVRWGLHARQRQSLDLPDAPEQNSWFFGLRRMLLGYAVGAGDAWRDIEPLDEIGGLDAVLAGQLALLLDRLDYSWQQLCQPATPVQWGERLRALLNTFFAADEGEDGFMLLQLDEGLQNWLEACESVALEQALPLSVVREHWLGLFEQSSLTQPFFAGAVTFATLMPMRAIPFRHVCLLGMNDGDYPRNRVPLDFDLMGQDYRPGDRSRREDDRYLFLEALLSAREQLYISWVGRSIHDNSERPPSVLVAQLRDHLSNGWQTVDGQAVLSALTVEHRLQPFSPDYFTAGSPLFSYAREWRAGLLPQEASMADAALDEYRQDGVLTLRQLADFVRDPVRSFFRLRLNVWFEQEDATSQDQEPFAIDALENWRLQHELIQVQKAALRQHIPREQALMEQLARIARRGELAPGGFTAVLEQDLAEPMADLFTRYEQEREKWPESSPDEPLSLPDVPLEDWLNELRADEQGNRCRLVLESGGLLHPTRRSYRFDKLVPFWVVHLAGHLGGQPLHSTLVSKNGTVHLPALEPEQAKAYWQTLVAAWREGMRYPLPLAVKTGFRWLEVGGEPDQPPDSEAGKAARQCYDEHDPANRKFAESASNAYLARAFPNFDQLWANGEFARWTQLLLAPLYQTLKAASAKNKKPGGQS